jgi:TrpR-related protein YerC/YecD
MNNITEENYREFYNSFLLLETEEEFRKFLEDICTPKELDAVIQRFCVAKMLRKKQSYQKINEATKASTATISRVSRSLENSNGGYNIVFERLGKKEDV